jgi:hypothetical protein
MDYQAGDPIIYMRAKPGKVIEELAGRYVQHPHGARGPYGWKRHLIFVGDKRLYVNITSIRHADTTEGSQK